MRTRRRGAGLVGMALVVALAGCGGDDDDAGSAATEAATTPAAPAEGKTSVLTTTETTPQTTPAETTPAAASSADLTPPGTKLAYGATATVGWVPASLSLKSQNTMTTLEITVESVTQGPESDLKNLNLDADQKGAVPYYLKVKIKNVDGTPPKEDDPDIALDAIDDRNQAQGSVTFIGDFPPCEDESPPQPFTAGKSYTSCLTYLMTGGGSIKEVRWNDGPKPKDGVSEYFEKPVVWSGA